MFEVSSNGRKLRRPLGAAPALAPRPVAGHGVSASPSR